MFLNHKFDCLVKMSQKVVIRETSLIPKKNFVTTLFIFFFANFLEYEMLPDSSPWWWLCLATEGHCEV